MIKSSTNRKQRSSTTTTNTLNDIIDSGVDVLEKLEHLEKVWPSLMTEMVQEILMDFIFMENYMKKELKKCQDTATIALHKNNKY